MKRNWTNITLREYYKIKSFIEEPDEWTTFNILDLLYDTDSANMTVNEFSKYNNALEFLSKEVPKVDIPKTITLNDRVYTIHKDLTTLNVAQFVDYQNYVKGDISKFEDILSVFIIPESHKYNDGYDIEQVKEDIQSINFALVHSLAFFFVKQFELFLSIFQVYLTQMIQKMNLPKDQKEELLKQLSQTDLSGEFFRSFLHMLEKRTQQSKMSLTNQ